MPETGAPPEARPSSKQFGPRPEARCRSCQWSARASAGAAPRLAFPPHSTLAPFLVSLLLLASRGRVTDAHGYHARRARPCGLAVVCWPWPPPPAAQTVTTPKQLFGFNIGDDYQLANYTQFVDYWQKLDKESDRMKVVEIGKTAEGRPQLMAIITSPENFKKLERYKEISRKLAHGRRADRRAGARAGEGRQGAWSGSTAACTPPKSSARSS